MSDKDKEIPVISLDAPPVEVHDLKSAESIVTRIIDLCDKERQEMNRPAYADLKINDTQMRAVIHSNYIPVLDYYDQGEIKQLPLLVHDSKNSEWVAPLKDFLEAFIVQPGSSLIMGNDERFFIDSTRGYWAYTYHKKVYTNDEYWDTELISKALNLYDITDDLFPDLSSCELNEINREVGAIGNFPPELSDMIANKLAT